ncbi:MAG: DUF3365 domain-containing protein [Gammaproteobacteria bacterium]|nr:DUF3365 domain-containing protein [Gammaproteobacteria bacterium]
MTRNALHSRLLAFALCAVTSLGFFPLPSHANDVEVASKELTTLFRAARKVLSDNQDLINDASKGDKGLSADKVIELTKSNFKQAAGKDLDLTDDGSPTAKAKLAMLDAVKSVMNDAQSLINEQGKGFKGFLPAVFAGRVAKLFSDAMAGKMSIKLTAPKAYLRNRANKPDTWESNIIETMFKSAGYEKGKAYSERADVKGKAAFRYILPEYYGPSCLACHGDPKGAKDITGGTKEGGKLDELGGAISLVIYD